MEIIYLVHARRVYTKGGSVIDTWLVRAESAYEARRKVFDTNEAAGHQSYYSMVVRRGLQPKDESRIVHQEAK